MSNSLSPSSARDFLARFHGAVNAHDAEALARLCTEDVVWTDPAAPEQLRGRDAVLRFHRDVMFRALPDVHVTLVDGPYVADEDKIAVRLRITGTMTGPLDPPGFAPTGSAIHFETAEFSQLKDGRLARHTVVLDMLALARQIGAVPPAGGIAERVSMWLQHLAARRARHRSAIPP
ncbi:MAG: ester cyclase [Myxococcales bacterium]|nr:ester cyclase [Myxococcales bacterium]